MAGLLSSLRQFLAAGGPAAGGGPEASARPRLPGDRAQWSFSTGNVIFRQGQAIDPKSSEGRTIETILARQRRDREANARQRAFVAALRQSAIPRAVVEGRAGFEAIKLGPGLELADLFTQRTSGGILARRR
jgi:hypothetical protein